MNTCSPISVLMWKDRRVYRAAVVGSGLVILAVMLWAIAGVKITEVHYARWRVQTGDAFCNGMLVIARLGLAAMALLAAVFGGMSIATERQQRSADLLAMMPVSRERIILSKTVVSAGYLGLILLANIVLIAIALWWHPAHSWLRGDDFWTYYASRNVQAIALFAGMAIMLFGVAWLMSAALSSAALAASISLAMGAMLLLLVGFTTDVTLLLDLLGTTYREGVRDWDMIRHARVLTAAVAVLVGVAAYTVGCTIYLRRVEP